MGKIKTHKASAKRFSVTGGGNCYCVAGGGGTDGEKDSACACVFAGWGRSTERHERCVCAMAGGGGTDD